MHVAKELKAVDSPLSSNREIKLRGVHLKVSDYKYLKLANSNIVGYTKLEKTNALNLDRIALTEKVKFLVYFDQAAIEQIQYGICVDDVANEWIAVISEAKHDVDLSWISAKAPVILLIAVAIPLIYACIQKSVSKTVRSADTEVVTTTETVSGGNSETYRYGAAVAKSTQTAEDKLNARITADKDDAEAERNSLSRVNPKSIASEDDTSNAKSDNGITSSPNTNYEESTEDLPYTKPSETVIVPEHTNETSDDDVLIAEVNLGGGNITVYSDNESASFFNPYDYTLFVTMSVDEKDVLEFSIAANSTQVINLDSVITETTKATIKYERDVDGSRKKMFETSIIIYVL